MSNATPRRQHTITMIRGHGIGPEISDAIMPLISAITEVYGASITWDIVPNSALDAYATGDTSEDNPLVASIRKNKVALKGPIDTPTGGGYRSVNVRLREQFATYACVRPIRSMPGVPTRFNDVDVVIFRENLEDLYCGLEMRIDDANPEVASAQRAAFRTLFGPRADAMLLANAAVALKVITPERSDRIIRAAFEYARTHRRNRVTCVHKANILKATDGLFLRRFEVIAQEYPEITADTYIADNITQQLVLRPERFDVIVFPNLYGDITSDLGAGLVGGLGVCPGANIGDEYAIFEATHGTAPDIAGQNKANPTAMLLSAAMMLDHVGERSAANGLRYAVTQVIARGNSVTADLLPPERRSEAVGTREMIAAMHAEIDQWTIDTILSLTDRQGLSAGQNEVLDAMLE